MTFLSLRCIPDEISLEERLKEGSIVLEKAFEDMMAFVIKGKVNKEHNNPKDDEAKTNEEEKDVELIELEPRENSEGVDIVDGGRNLRGVQSVFDFFDEGTLDVVEQR